MIGLHFDITSKAVFIAPEVHKELKELSASDKRTLSQEVAFLIVFYKARRRK